MSDTWGTAPAKKKVKEPKRPLNPKSVRAGHQGIAWLHISGIAIWLLVAAVFGLLMALGKNLPPVLLIATLGAAAGHGLFLMTHMYLASAAKKRIAATEAARVTGAATGDGAASSTDPGTSTTVEAPPATPAAATRTAAPGAATTVSSAAPRAASAATTGTAGTGAGQREPVRR